jgi:hypothetical protein
MLSAKLVQLIENNWEEITTRLIRSVRAHPGMLHLSKRPDLELREWCRDILANLGVLLTASKDEDVNRRFEEMGRHRFEEDIPLHEAVLRFHLLNDGIVRFIHEQGFPMTALQLYAEEELEQRVGRFFDSAVYSVVCGYERAWTHAGKLAGSASSTRNR